MLYFRPILTNPSSKNSLIDSHYEFMGLIFYNVMESPIRKYSGIIKNCYRRGGFIKSGVIVQDSLEEKMQPLDQTRQLIIDEATASTSKAMETELCEVDGDVRE